MPKATRKRRVASAGSRDSTRAARPASARTAAAAKAKGPSTVPAPDAAIIAEELRQARRQLALRTVELGNLVDLSRELQQGGGEAAVVDHLLTGVMGHFVVSRAALLLGGPGRLTLAGERGLRQPLLPPSLAEADARAALDGLDAPRAASELAPGPLRRWLEGARLALAVPLLAGARATGLVAIGERSSGAPYSVEDREIALALARQAESALENARLQQVREEKQRQDRELAVARGIQQSLLPPRPPRLAGFELAARSRPCYEVGGDAFDWIPLAGGRLGLVVADVAGKGTPASLLASSTHAFVHALAGTLPPAELVARLNRFLFARTQASRFVTLVYAELDTERRQLDYVNAGHVPPFRLAPDGSLSRLRDGGPALGLLEDADYAPGRIELEPGELVALLTDGVTEAMSAVEAELGDERVGEALQRLAAQEATAVLEGLVATVDAWAGSRGASDDLTALVLKAGPRA